MIGMEYESGYSWLVRETVEMLKELKQSYENGETIVFDKEYPTVCRGCTIDQIIRMLYDCEFTVEEIRAIRAWIKELDPIFELYDLYEVLSDE